MSTKAPKKGSAADLLASLKLPTEPAPTPPPAPVAPPTAAAPSVKPPGKPKRAAREKPSVKKEPSSVEINSDAETASQKFSISMFGRDVSALNQIESLLFQSEGRANPSLAVKVALRFSQKRLDVKEVKKLLQEIKGEDRRRRGTE